MPRGGAIAADEEAIAAMPKGTPTREKLKGFVVRRYSTRLHMSLILASCGLVAMSTSWSLLHLGVHSMLVRYPAAMVMAYATFLIGVWVWLRVTGLIGNSPDAGSARKAKSSKGDWIGDLSPGGSSGSSGGGGGGGGGVFRGGGGSFDGGGANASFAENNMPLMSGRSGSSSSSSKSGSGGGLSLDIDGDGIVLLLLAAALILAVFLTSGYLIWCAPDVLTEAAFGAALTGSLVRPTKTHGASGWIEGVVKKTWWPFAVVLLLATAFAGWASVHYPQASTFRQAIAMAVHNDH